VAGVVLQTFCWSHLPYQNCLKNSMPHKKHGIIAFGAVFLSKYGAFLCFDLGYSCFEGDPPQTTVTISSPGGST